MNRHLPKSAVLLTLLSLSIAKADTTLVTKFTFDSPDSIAPWHEDVPKDQPSDSISLDGAQSHSGAGALKFSIVRPGDSPRTIYTGITLPADPAAGRRLRLRFYARSSEGALPRVSLLERSQTSVIGWVQSKAFFPMDAPADWKENVIEVPLTDNTRVLTLFFGVGKPTAGQTLWVDDVSAEIITP